MMYLANYATGADFDCYRDDNGDADTMHDLAEPRGVILSSLDSVPLVLAIAFKEWSECDDSMPKGQWACTRNSDGYQTWEYHTPHQVYGVVQIHPKEVF